LKKLKCTNQVSNTLSFLFLFGAFSKKVMVLSTAISLLFSDDRKCIEMLYIYEIEMRGLYGLPIFKLLSESRFSEK